MGSGDLNRDELLKKEIILRINLGKIDGLIKKMGKRRKRLLLQISKLEEERLALEQEQFEVKRVEPKKAPKRQTKRKKNLEKLWEQVIGDRTNL